MRPPSYRPVGAGGTSRLARRHTRPIQGRSMLSPRSVAEVRDGGLLGPLSVGGDGRGDPPVLKVSRETLCVHWGHRRCFLGYTIPFRLMERLSASPATTSAWTTCWPMYGRANALEDPPFRTRLLQIQVRAWPGRGWRTWRTSSMGAITGTTASGCRIRSKQIRQQSGANPTAIGQGVVKLSWLPRKACGAEPAGGPRATS